MNFGRQSSSCRERFNLFYPETFVCLMLFKLSWRLIKHGKISLMLLLEGKKDSDVDDDNDDDDDEDGDDYVDK